jgi:hypothetical protein
VANVSDRFADQLVGHTVRVQRFGEGVREKVSGLLSELEDDLERQIRRARFEDAVQPSTRLRRAEELQRYVRETIGESTAKQSKLVRGELVELASASAENFSRMTKKAFSSNLLSAEFTSNGLKRLVDDTIIHGNPASVWWGKQSADLQVRFQQQIRLGLLQGETVDQMIRRVRGDQTGRRVIEVDGQQKVIKTFSGGILSTNVREAGALVRTATQAVANRVMMDGYEQNADVIKALQAIVTLDLKTSDFCIAISGGVWYLESKEPTPESKIQIPFPGLSPYHFNCRTVLGPVTFSWEELIDKHSKRTRVGKVLDSVPNSVRASVDGKVAGELDYEGWLRKKSPADQIEALGKTKRELWINGDLTLPQLIDQSGRSITVAELKVAMDAPDAVELLINKLGEAHSLDAVSATLKTHPVLRDFEFKIDDPATDLAQLKESAASLVRNLDALGPELSEIAFGKRIEANEKFAPLSLRVTPFPDGNAWARANYYKGGRIELNALYMSNPALYAESAKAADTTHWMAVAVTPRSTLSHEFGHIVDHMSTGGIQFRTQSPLDAYLGNKTLQGSFVERWENTVRAWLKKTWDADVEASADLPQSFNLLPRTRIGAELSKYARTNTDELFAEAWSVMVERPKAQWPGIVQELAAEMRKAFEGSGLPMPKILQ